MLRSQSIRQRRSSYAPQLCAAAAALLLLISLSVLHTRLSSASPFHLGLGLRTVLSHPHDPTSPDLPHSTVSDPHTDASLADPHNDRRRSAGEDDILRGAGLDDDADDSDEPELPRSPRSGFFWDHAAGVARRSFGKQERHRSDPWGDRFFPFDGDDALQLRSDDKIRMAFGSDNQPVDEDIRLKLDSIRHIEDALMLKVGAGGGNSLLRDGWARWLEGKADFLRSDQMLQSNLELLNPKNHPLLQDPDMPGVTSLTRGDRLMQRAIWKELEAIWKELEEIPFGGGGDGEIKKVELRKPLHLEQESKNASTAERHIYADGRRWGYFPGLDQHLTFSEFMDRFLEGDGQCGVRVFMVWNSPPWMYGVRHQRGLESLLYHHKDACVVVFSETMELDFFKDFVEDGFRVAVVMPNLDELLKDTPTHVFASVWFDWKKTKHYPIHYSELIRLAALYKYGGVYIDSDIIVLKTLYSLENSVGSVDQTTGNSILNGAVMSFKRHSPFLMECLAEFYSSYDDTRLRWNGADLLTRVLNRLHGKGDKSDGQLDIKTGPIQFFPISYANITRYFVAATDEIERTEQDALLKRILNESITFHFWNGLTSALIPEPNSLTERLLNQYCLRCLDVL